FSEVLVKRSNKVLQLVWIVRVPLNPFDLTRNHAAHGAHDRASFGLQHLGLIPSGDRSSRWRSTGCGLFLRGSITTRSGILKQWPREHWWLRWIQLLLDIRLKLISRNHVQRLEIDITAHFEWVHVLFFVDVVDREESGLFAR